MTTSLNAHGDRLLPTTGTHGADISSQRLDELDAAALRHALGLADRRGAVLDLGCGIGLQALRLASTGLPTLMIDRLPLERTVLGVDGVGAMLPLRYLMKDARELRDDELPDGIVVAYSQRFIHYLRFAEAVILLKRVHARMAPGGKLFLSASGLLSELGEGYAHRDTGLAERFAPLSDAMADKHGILESVCLYAPGDLAALGEAAGFRPERIDSSEFGNVKGIFTGA